MPEHLRIGTLDSSPTPARLSALVRLFYPSSVAHGTSVEVEIELSARLSFSARWSHSQDADRSGREPHFSASVKQDRINSWLPDDFRGAMEDVIGETHGLDPLASAIWASLVTEAFEAFRPLSVGACYRLEPTGSAYYDLWSRLVQLETEQVNSLTGPVASLV